METRTFRSSYFYTGANVEAVYSIQRTALHLACKLGNLDMVKLILANRASITAQDQHGCSPLELAVESENLAIVQFLLQHGAPVNAVNNLGNSPLHVATRLNCIPIISCLLAAGAMADKPSKDGTTPLHICALYEQTEVLQLLPKTGDNKPNPAASDNGPTVHPLFCGAINLEAIDAFGKTPLYLAIQVDLKESVRIFCKTALP